MPATFGDRLKELRTERGMTQQEFADLLGTTKQAISRYEAHARSPKIAVAKSFADRLSVDLYYLIGAEDVRNPLQNNSTSGSITFATESNVATNSPNRRALLDLADSASLVKMPIVGSIKAGYGGTAVEEETGEYELLPDDCMRGGEYFVLRVNGNSMQPELKDGDRVLCKRAPSVDSGNIAVVLYGEEATIKRVNYINGEDWLELIPANPSYETKRIEGAELESCRVLGKVVQLIRRADALGIAAEQADVYEKAVNSPLDNEDELTVRFMNLIRRLPDDKKEAIYLLLKDIQPKE